MRRSSLLPIFIVQYLQVEHWKIFITLEFFYVIWVKQECIGIRFACFKVLREAGKWEALNLWQVVLLCCFLVTRGQRVSHSMHFFPPQILCAYHYIAPEDV